jgi:hypothetical protein
MNSLRLCDSVCSVGKIKHSTGNHYLQHKQQHAPEQAANDDTIAKTHIVHSHMVKTRKLQGLCESCNPKILPCALNCCKIRLRTIICCVAGSVPQRLDLIGRLLGTQHEPGPGAGRWHKHKQASTSKQAGRQAQASTSKQSSKHKARASCGAPAQHDYLCSHAQARSERCCKRPSACAWGVHTKYDYCSNLCTMPA